MAAKREQRVLLAEAQAVAPTVIVQREPEEILLDALHDTNTTLQKIKHELSVGAVNPLMLTLAGDWLDRVMRIGKVVVDGELADRLERRIGWLAADRAATVWGHLAAIVEASPLTAGQRWELWQARFAGLELIRDGRAPYRLSNDEVHRFTTALQVAAAREEALAEGLPGDELKPDPDEDDDAASLVLSSNDGNGWRG